MQTKLDCLVKRNSTLEQEIIKRTCHRTDSTLSGTKSPKETSFFLTGKKDQLKTYNSEIKNGPLMQKNDNIGIRQSFELKRISL